MGRIFYKGAAGLFSGMVFCGSLYAAEVQSTQQVQEDKSPLTQSQPIHRQFQILYFSGHEDEAIQKAKAFLEKNPDEGNVRLVLAQFYMDRKQYDLARLQLNHILKEVPKYLEARLALIQVDLAEKKYEHALFLVQQGLALTPDNKALQTAKSDVDAALASVQAEKPVVESVKLEGLEPVKPVTVARAQEYLRLRKLYQSGKKEEAIKQAKDYLKKNPDDGDVRLILAQFYVDQKQYTKAREQLNLVLTATPEYVEARLMLIRLDLTEKKYSHAELLVEKGLVLSPKHAGLLQAKKDIAYAQRPTAIAKAPAKPGVLEHKRLQKIYQSGKKQLAINEAIRYLKKYPNDGDVRLVLGQFYMQQKEYDKAAYQFQRALAITPTYTAVRASLINALLLHYKYAEAKRVLDEGLKMQPNNLDLMSAKANFYFEKGRFYQAAKAVKRVLAKAPKNEFAQEVVEKLNALSPRFMIGPNVIGGYTTNLLASDLHQTWDYSTVYYGRDTDIGYFAAKVNYANRFGIDAPQYELEAYPVLNKFVYFYLDVGYANEPVLFPNNLMGAEAFVVLPNFVDVSLGGKYHHITSDKAYSYYTGSVGKQIGNHLLTFRPYYFTPNAGSNSLLYTGQYRYYFNGDPDRFIEVGGGTGKSPDLNNLLDANFVTIDNDFVYFNCVFPLFAHTVLVNFGASYTNQYYPTPGLKRILRGGVVGLAKRF